MYLKITAVILSFMDFPVLNLTKVIKKQKPQLFVLWFLQFITGVQL